MGVWPFSGRIDGLYSEGVAIFTHSNMILMLQNLINLMFP